MLKFKHWPKDRIYNWTGISALGHQQSGQMRAKNPRTIRSSLGQQGIILKSLYLQNQNNRAIRRADIYAFFQQLSNLVAANLSLQESIKLILSSSNHRQLIIILSKIHGQLASGQRFSETLQTFPKFFDPFIFGLIRLGEESGRLPSILQQITAHLHQHEKFKQQIRSILSYPLVVLVTALLISLHLSLNVIPQFKTLFDNTGTELPMMTALLIQAASHIKAVIPLGLVMLLMSLTLFPIAYQKILRLKQCCHRLILKIPSVGELTKLIVLTRSLNALVIANQAGLPFVEGLKLVALSTGNLCFTQAFLTLRQALIEGDSMRIALYHSPLFPELLRQILSLGEESGTLTTLISDLSTYYTQDLARHMQDLSQVLEPAIMLFLGLLVAILILALYCPIIQLGTLI